MSYVQHNAYIHIYICMYVYIIWFFIEDEFLHTTINATHNTASGHTLALFLRFKSDVNSISSRFFAAGCSSDVLKSSKTRQSCPLQWRLLRCRLRELECV